MNLSLLSLSFLLGAQGKWLFVTPCDLTDARQSFSFNDTFFSIQHQTSQLPVLDIPYCDPLFMLQLHLAPSDNNMGACDGKNQQWVYSAEAFTFRSFFFSQGCLSVWDGQGHALRQDPALSSALECTSVVVEPCVPGSALQQWAWSSQPGPRRLVSLAADSSGSGAASAPQCLTALHSSCTQQAA
jgi:hypothetical protein